MAISHTPSTSTNKLSAFVAAPSWPLVAAGLIGGYAVAASTGIRPLGGIVLAGAAVTAGTMWWRRGHKVQAAALSALYLGSFVGSHMLAKQIGAWPSVLTVAGICAAATYFTSDRLTRTR